MAEREKIKRALNDPTMRKGTKGDFGHASKPMKIDAFSAQRKDVSRVSEIPANDRGNPQQAYAYQY